MQEERNPKRLRSGTNDETQTPPIRMTYANATMTNTPNATRPTQPRTTQLTQDETERFHRTQILRRLPYATTPTLLINELTTQLEVREHKFLEQVLQDPSDRRRYYVTYRTLDMKRHATTHGFHILGTHIKPTDDTTAGYIPYPPYYINETTLTSLLSNYGTVTTGHFIQTDQHTRIAGYKFNIRLNTDIARPTELKYNDCTMTIKYEDDIRQCRHCKRFGHLVGQCRTRQQQQLQRNDEQQNTEATRRETEVNLRHQNTEQLQNNTTTPNEQADDIIPQYSPSTNTNEDSQDKEHEEEHEDDNTEMDEPLLTPTFTQLKAALTKQENVNPPPNYDPEINSLYRINLHTRDKYIKDTITNYAVNENLIHPHQNIDMTKTFVTRKGDRTSILLPDKHTTEAIWKCLTYLTATTPCLLKDRTQLGINSGHQESQGNKEQRQAMQHFVTSTIKKYNRSSEEGYS